MTRLCLWDYFWFVPLALYLILRVFWENLELAHSALLAIIHNHGFFVIYSMSYDLWLAAVSALLFFPWIGLFLIVGFFDPSGQSYKHRYRLAFLTAAGTYTACVILLLLVDGSWPWVADTQGHIHLRIFPFVPYGSGWVNVP